MESISEKGLGLIERARGVSLRQTRLIKPDDLELARLGWLTPLYGQKDSLNGPDC